MLERPKKTTANQSIHYLILFLEKKEQNPNISQKCKNNVLTNKTSNPKPEVF